MHAVGANELYAPLGLRVRGSHGRGARLLARGAGIGVAIAVGTVASVAIWGDREAGRPEVRVAIAPLAAAPPVQAAATPNGVSPGVASMAGRGSGAAVEAASGVVVIRSGGDVPSSVFVSVPDEAPRPGAADDALQEAGRYGPLPRVSAAGARPVDAYARPAGRLPGGVEPRGRVALVVGGLGLSRTTTDEALSRLPAAVTLAFAPYGRDLDASVRRARAAGHEIVLQIPMEPSDGSAGDPGPKALSTAAGPADNLDRLRWSLSRVSGYVAVMNYLGGRFTTDPVALGPVTSEIARRGLGVVDDGSSARSVLLRSAEGAPAARAELAVDADPAGDAIDRNLDRLERLAASGRTIVATASALPVSIDRIAAWTRRLESRGILLVPVTSALRRSEGANAGR